MAGPQSAYRRGQGIGGQFTVVDVLGRGGYGIVYRVRSKWDDREWALKTFRDEFILDPRIKNAFRREAETWIALGRHSFILEAQQVHEFDGRLYVAMEYIAPDEDGLVTLQDHIEYHRRNITDRMISTWAIEFCHGITHAYQKGLTAHRDIKPANVLVGASPFIKISDFGIAASIGDAKLPPGILSAVGLSAFTLQGRTMCGTLGYIAPEIYVNGFASVQSDIYSFGSVLWQLCAGAKRPPFFPALCQAPDPPTSHLVLSTSQVPPIDTIFWHVIRRCLEVDLADRYADFDEIRHDIKVALDRAGEEKMDFVVNTAPSFDRLVNEGASLRALGRFEQALQCYEAAVQLQPKNAAVWVNKGNVLSSMGRDSESMRAYNHALLLDSKFEAAWLNKGILLHRLERYPEAIQCFDKLLGVNPRRALAWNRKGRSLAAQDRNVEAIECYKKALEILPADEVTCTNMAEALSHLGNKPAALSFLELAIKANPKHRNALIEKATILVDLTRFAEALQFLDDALALDPEDLSTLNTKAVVLCRLNRQRDAIPLFDFLLANVPDEADVLWTNKGNAFGELGDWKTALACFERALAANSQYGPARSQKVAALKHLQK